jgi:hypothetical protein
MKCLNTNHKKSIRNKAIKTIDKSRNIWKMKFYDSQEELRKEKIKFSTYYDLWQQAEKSLQELKNKKEVINISRLNALKEAIQNSKPHSMSYEDIKNQAREKL